MTDSTPNEMVRPEDICSRHINTAAKEAFAIMGEPHWLYQLQMAVRIIEQHEKALAQAQLELNGIDHQIDNANEKLEAIIGSGGSDTQDRIDLSQEKTRLLSAKNEIEPLMRDTKHLLNSAINLREHIWSQAIQLNPEIAAMGYEAVQVQFSPQALTAQITHTYVAEKLAMALGVSVPMADTLLKLPAEQRQLVLSQGKAQFEVLIPSGLLHMGAIQGAGEAGEEPDNLGEG